MHPDGGLILWFYDNLSVGVAKYMGRLLGIYPFHMKLLHLSIVLAVSAVGYIAVTNGMFILSIVLFIYNIILRLRAPVLFLIVQIVMYCINIRHDSWPVIQWVSHKHQSEHFRKYLLNIYFMSISKLGCKHEEKLNVK